jgi:hypothetical protein
MTVCRSFGARGVFATATMVLMMCTGAVAQNADQMVALCGRIVSDMSREYMSSQESNAILDSVFDQHCQSDGSVRQGGTQFGLSVVVKALPVGLNFGSSSSDSSASSFCKDYRSRRQLTASRSSEEQKLSKRAFDSLDSCMALAAKGAAISHQLIGRDRVAFAISPGQTRLRIVGVDTSQIECDGFVASSTTRVPVNRELSVDVQEPVSITCKREPASRAPDGSWAYSEASVIVQTNLGLNYPVVLPESKKFADATVAEMQSDIASLRGLMYAPLGTVIASALPWERFREHVPDADVAWVPADGRSIPESSPFRRLGLGDLSPDLRGVFLRGLGEFEAGKSRSDGKGDPESRKALSYQADQLGSHVHRERGRRAAVPHGGGGHAVGYLDDPPQYEYSTEATGGSETRPRNVAVYYYLKIK